MSDATREGQLLREGQMLIGKYALEKRLGVGSMGEVYRARNAAIDRVVAIKILRKEHARNDQVVTRFLREAKAANMVQHRNVAQVLDVGQDEEGVPFIVQEYLEGRDLADMLKEFEFGMPVPLALNLFLPITQAMAAVHGKGLVHRDLKPENIMLARVDGMTIPKVLDFGVSKMQQSASDVRLTGTSMIMGSPVYMCPEQIQKPQTVDARADVWALGVMLYEALSAQLPFDSNNISTLFIKICNGTFTPLDEVAHSVPPSVVSIVHRCLKVDREERFADATALAKALTQAAGRSPESVEQLRGGALDVSALPLPNGGASPRGDTASAPTLMAPVVTMATPAENVPNASASIGGAPRTPAPVRPGVLATPATPKPVSRAPAEPARISIPDPVPQAPVEAQRPSVPASRGSFPPASAFRPSSRPSQAKSASKSRLPVLLALLAITIVLAGIVLTLLVTSAPPSSSTLPSEPPAAAE